MHSTANKLEQGKYFNCDTQFSVLKRLYFSENEEDSCMKAIVKDGKFIDTEMILFVFVIYVKGKRINKPIN